MQTTISPATSSRRDWWAVLFALVLPTLVTLVYFVWAARYESGIQQIAYTAAKVVQFIFPAFWVLVIVKNRPAWSKRPGMLLGGLFGLLVMVAMLWLYHSAIKSMPFFQQPAEKITGKIIGLGINSVWAYAMLGLFYSALHSLLEEYYWRWFVFRQLDGLTSANMAIVISSLGFMTHHVVVLASFFGWLSPLTWIFSFCVALGGAFWAWLYRRSGSLLPAWLSHALVDAAIFLIGYDLAF
jgi:CAAX protease family protein